MAHISDAMLLHRLANVRERPEGLLDILGTMSDSVYRPRPLTDDEVPARVLPDPAQTWDDAEPVADVSAGREPHVTRGDGSHGRRATRRGARFFVGSDSGPPAWQNETGPPGRATMTGVT
jgi:hypothetical protein